MEKNDFYVYVHFRNDNKEPFYIGKGRKNRVHAINGRNPYWKNIVKKYGYYKKIISDGLEEEFAYRLEQVVIKVYRSVGFELSNMNNGGKGGNSGTKHTQEHKKKISDSLKGRIPKFIPNNKGRKHSKEFIEKNRIRNIGKIMSEETRDKISAAMKIIRKKQREANSKQII